MNEKQTYMDEWFTKHQQKMLNEGVYTNPCEGCSGEDCACCSYGTNN